MKPLLFVSLLIFNFVYLATSSEGICCVCVPYALCENDVITTNGQKILRLTSEEPNISGRATDVQTCPRKFLSCCRPPSADPNCVIELSGNNLPTVRPNRPLESPWIGLIVQENNTPTVIGTASLIHPQVLLTAAHNVYKHKNEPLSMRMGNPSTDRRFLKYQNMKIQKVIIHPGFDPRNLRNDFALLFLVERIAKNDRISAIRLTRSLSKLDLGSCIASSADAAKTESEGKLANIATFPSAYVDANTCQAALRRTRLSKYFRLHPSFMCAATTKRNELCKLQGGGSFACKTKSGGKYKQIGVISWAVGCNDGKSPSVMASIPGQMRWIKREIRKIHSKKHSRRNKVLVQGRRWKNRRGKKGRRNKENRRRTNKGKNKQIIFKEN